MVTEVQIENYKSIQSLKIELGRLNVLIGENGCGKSNILEAIAIGSAAAKNNLQNPSLSARGIRITSPQLLRSGFQSDTSVKNIQVKFIASENKFQYNLRNSNEPFSEWTTEEMDEDRKIILNLRSYLELIDKYYSNIDSPPVDTLQNIASIKKRLKKVEDQGENKKAQLDKFSSRMKPFFDDFSIYSPENYFLRKFEEDNQALGIRGEGLFKLLTVLASENLAQFEKIKQSLKLIDWFDDFEIPTDLAFTEKRIQIKDRFLDEGLKFFDQRSANEGFLFLLFYFTLFISDYTPKFFSVDNIDNALNPKLCRKLIERLAQLSKEHDKQAILTTHNPAVLDGLNLEDDDQRLFVVYRNADGFTKVRRILKPQMPNGVEPVRLSEMFLRGSIGGLPKNF
jgi:predicted ATPase